MGKILPDACDIGVLLPSYPYNWRAAMNRKLVERAQTGVRIEKSLLKVLKGLAEYCDLTLGDLLEGIVLHTFEGKLPFSVETQGKISDLKKIYQCDLGAEDSHRLKEAGE
jgi:hypothetical protein